MSIVSQSTQQKFPFPYDAVFDGLLAAIQHLGFDLKSHDKLIGRISASTGVSAFSYGENLTFRVERMDDSNTLVNLESGLKVGVNLAGAHRHAQNFERIIAALSSRLQRRPGSYQGSADLTPSSTGQKAAGSLKRIGLLLLILLGGGLLIGALFGMLS